MRNDQESVAVLIEALDDTEKELFDLRGFYLEEVRLCVRLTEENRWLEASRYDTRRALSHAKQAHCDDVARLVGQARKRDRWLGFALAAAMALGGYVGFLVGCAS